MDKLTELQSETLRDAVQFYIELGGYFNRYDKRDAILKVQLKLREQQVNSRRQIATEILQEVAK
jgi:hypothetical protein